MNWSEIQQKFKQLTISEKLIVINILVFISVGLGSFIFKGGAIEEWFALSSDIESLLYRPWTIISYTFLHVNFIHLFFNMLMLFFVGQFFLNLLGRELFLKTYILGGISGAFFFLILCLLAPPVLISGVYLEGASAGIMSLLIFLCTFFPQRQVQLFVFSVKLWVLGLVLVMLDLYRLTDGNSGGYVSHLGGAILGFSYAYFYKKGYDFGSWLDLVEQSLTDFFDRTLSKSKMKVVHKAPAERVRPYKTINQNEKVIEAKIDAILDKISVSGYESLTQKEKDFLLKQK